MIRGLVLIFLLGCGNALEWYDGGNFYQIYPRSYKDSDGDGIGDLQGIISKLQYVKDLGMDGLWLSPIMKSPQADFGYDISDYRDIHEEYGTLDDMKQLIAECDRIGLRLILDFVPNHTSDEHEWFIKSENKVPGFEDFTSGATEKSTSTPTSWFHRTTGSASSVTVLGGGQRSVSSSTSTSSTTSKLISTTATRDSFRR